MLLILMRHGIAAEAKDGNDFDRSLTDEGRDRTHRAAVGLTRLVEKFEVIISSPKRRAQQTAQMVRDVYGKIPLQTWDELADNGVNAWLDKLRQCEQQTVLLVGHEPDLSEFTALLLTGKRTGMQLDFKKAGVCALELDLSQAKPRAVLHWLLTPKALRKLGK